MGTRNLTVVKSNDEIKVAQYGQWDGYPGGQGETIINFIEEEFDLEKFKEKVNKLEFFTEKEIEQINSSGQIFETYPYLSRDLGADILHAIMYGEYKKRNINYTTGEENYITYDFEIKKLVDSFEFGADSLFCEWAYVLDLDENYLYVYEGFQKEPHNKGIFANIEIEDNNGYYQCKPIVKFDLKKDGLRERWNDWLEKYNESKRPE